MGTRKVEPHPKTPNKGHKKRKTGVTCAALGPLASQGVATAGENLALAEKDIEPRTTLAIAAERNPEAVYFTHTRPHQTFYEPPYISVFQSPTHLRDSDAICSKNGWGCVG
jgi:hypothetical protein